MSPFHALTAEERLLLKAAMAAPLCECEPHELGLCLKLCSLKLLQRAGATAAANGWRGSPHAFFLTRDGWALMKQERRGAPVRRAG